VRSELLKSKHLKQLKAVEQAGMKQSNSPAASVYLSCQDQTELYKAPKLDIDVEQ